MTTVIRDEIRVPPREKILTKHPRGDWLLRRRVDEWATQATRNIFIAGMEDFVATRSWSRSWTVTERFANNSINRAVPRGPALLIQGQEPGAQRPYDEEFLKARLKPILIFRVVRDRDSAVMEVTLDFPQVNSTPMAPKLAQAVEALDAIQRTT